MYIVFFTHDCLEMLAIFSGVYNHCSRW